MAGNAHRVMCLRSQRDSAKPSHGKEHAAAVQASMPQARSIGRG
jgi:hypothetical protein